MLDIRIDYVTICGVQQERNYIPMTPNSITPPATSPQTPPATSKSHFFESLEHNLANGQRMTVKHLASSANVSIAAMRKSLIAHYGGCIIFQKGRTGGIMINLAKAAGVIKAV